MPKPTFFGRLAAASLVLVQAVMRRVPRLRLDSGLLRRRGTALMLALAIEILVILALLFLLPPLAGDKQPGRTTVFSVDAPGEEQAEASSTPKAQAKARPEPVAVRPAVPPPEIPPPPVPPVPRGELPFIVMTREEYRAAQITNYPQRPAEPAAAAGGASASANDSPLAGGKGPGGEPLYAAEWYVRPTRAQLSTYIGDRARASGWGLIACRTIANYRVEDCQELGEAPRGSGLAGAVRQAAWQFKVRPPRVGGKDMVGEWVSIRIDYTITRE